MHPSSNAAPPSDPIVASLPDGRQLPVIDIAHPAFAVTLTDDQLEARARAHHAEAAARGKLSSARLAALSQSTLGRAMTAASGSYLGGLATYVFKLGPEHLGSCDSPVDRAIAESFPALTMRVRLQDVSRLLADGLAPALRSGDPGRPLLLLNIAGGVAADDWNALLLLHRQRPSLVVGRAVTIAVLDLDREGPAFGAAAVAALTAPAGPLENVTVDFRPVVYDWSSPDSLGATLGALTACDAICGVSTEGGLFEYGSDEAIVSNLRALASGTPRDAIVVGTVTHDSDRARELMQSGGPAIIPRSEAAFRRLADAAGWRLESLIDRPVSRHVRLIRAD